MDRRNRLGEAPIRSLFFQFYTPALISMLSCTVHQDSNGINRTRGTRGEYSVTERGSALIKKSIAANHTIDILKRTRRWKAADYKIAAMG